LAVFREVSSFYERKTTKDGKIKVATSNHKIPFSKSRVSTGGGEEGKVVNGGNAKGGSFKIQPPKGISTRGGGGSVQRRSLGVAAEKGRTKKKGKKK